MQHNNKIWLLATITIIVLVSIFLLPPIAQPQAFHQFADGHEFFGIHNFSNVMSNLPFILVGIFGFTLLRNSNASITINVLFSVLFFSIILTALGSGLYHSNPNNNTLIWDRMPMTIIFMSFMSITVSELINPKLGFALFFPLVLLGISSVLWWHYTEDLGHGDLRLYFFVQYYPMIFIPVVTLLYYRPNQKSSLRYLGFIVAWYIVAKIFEHFDQNIYAYLGISGHTLKHLAAAVSTLYFVLLFKMKYVSAETQQNILSSQI